MLPSRGKVPTSGGVPPAALRPLKQCVCQVSKNARGGRSTVASGLPARSTILSSYWRAILLVSAGLLAPHCASRRSGHCASTALLVGRGAAIELYGQLGDR